MRASSSARPTIAKRLKRARRCRGSRGDWCAGLRSARLRDEELDAVFFVISTPQDDELSARLRSLADRYRFLLCCIDQPDYGFVAMAAIAKAGPVRVAISTTGLAPRVGKALKNGLQRVMDAKFVRFIERLAVASARKRRRAHPAAGKVAGCGGRR